jgi:hypothetical protein
VTPRRALPKRGPFDSCSKQHARERFGPRNRPSGVACDCKRRGRRSARSDRPGPSVSCKRRSLAMGDVCCEYRGRIDARLLRNALAGAPASVHTASSIAGHRAVWCAHHLLHGADRAIADGRQPSLRPCRWLPACKRNRWIPCGVRILRARTPREDDRVRMLATQNESQAR